ncbi:prolipoprotein diacylglyceryl transferase [Actinoallomurus sp. NPDC050550]|uniref:prolipoprotein diacylglyceryl transferase n=1 Tax=Actinoallomurus sp. NPDC050550 TaxID=3154937 RepID=UPI0033E0F59A
MQQPLAFIPSPSQGSIHLGPLPLRGYALMIIIGVIVAVWLGERRWTARGGASGTVVDIAVWAVPFGLIGGRLYHVITDHQLYFGHGRHPIDAFKVWNGGLGIWGAIALGTFGAYLGCRRRGISLRVFADAAAPGIVLAQAIGRWGNWFNQELYGRPSKLPWAVKIDPAHRPPNTPDIATYQPTFLYEFLWCVGVAVLVIWAEKRFRLVYGRAFALYVAAYTVGRAWIEWLRVDPAHHILGLRLNDWTALIVFLCAVAYIYFQRDKTENPPGAFGTAAEESAAEEPTREDDAVAADTAVATLPAGEKQAEEPTQAKDAEKPVEPTEAEAPAEPDEAAGSEDATEAVEAAEVAEKTEIETAEPKDGESTTDAPEGGESATDVAEDGADDPAEAPSAEAAEEPEAGDARAPERSEADEAEPADDDAAAAPGDETEDGTETTDSQAAGDAPNGEESRSESDAAAESEVSTTDDEKDSPAGKTDRSSAGRGA